MNWITPYHLSTDFPEDLSSDDKLTIFSEQVLGWQLDIADACINGKLAVMRHSGFAVMHIVFSYFEMIAAFKGLKPIPGERGAGQFNAGVMDVFVQLASLTACEQSDILKILYVSVRCGLYHQARTRRRVVLSGDYPDTLGWDSLERVVRMNPHKLVPVMKQHFHQYVCSLRDPANTGLREAFESNFDRTQAEDPLT